MKKACRDRSRTSSRNAAWSSPACRRSSGFQLIAVFSPRFDSLGHTGQMLHLVSIALVAVSIALVMTPAAYHRQCLPDGVSEEFIALTSKLLLRA